MRARCVRHVLHVPGLRATARMRMTGPTYESALKITELSRPRTRFCRLSPGRALARARVRPDARAMRSTRFARPRASRSGMRKHDRTWIRVETQNHRAESTLDAFLSFVTRPRGRACATEGLMRARCVRHVLHVPGLRAAACVGMTGPGYESALKTTELSRP